MAKPSTDLAEIVRRAEVVVHDIIGRPLQQPGVDLEISDFGREIEELAEEIEGKAVPRDPKANFWGLKDPYVDQAREWIDYLLDVDAPRYRAENTEAYASEILLCAEAVRKLLSRMALSIAPRKKERVPGVIMELSRSIDALRAAGISTPAQSTT